MTEILKLYWGLCRFRSGPEQMPWSRELLVVTLLFWLGLQLITAWLQQTLPGWVTLAAQGISLAVLLGSAWLLLKFKGLSARWLQTAVALTAAETFFALLGIPMVLAANAADATTLPLWLESFFYLILCWELGVWGFVFHRALQVGPVLAIFLALTIMILGWFVVALLLPQTLGAVTGQGG